MLVLEMQSKVVTGSQVTVTLLVKGLLQKPLDEIRVALQKFWPSRLYVCLPMVRSPPVLLPAFIVTFRSPGVRLLAQDRMTMIVEDLLPSSPSRPSDS